MDQARQTRVETAGWQVGSVADFLELSVKELQLVEIRLALTAKRREARQRPYQT